MNTDNMSVLGLTIDYGPYGWVEDYDPDWTPNTTDKMGRRYRFGHQPQIALWNLVQFANSLLPLIEQTEPLQQGLRVYSRCFEQGWQTMMAQKLGLNTFDPDTDEELTNELLAVLQLVETDMTVFYRKLALVDVDAERVNDGTHEALIAPLMDAYYVPEQLTSENRARICDWIRCYKTRVSKDHTPDDIRRQRMNAVNPKYVLRNYLAQLAIDKAENGDISMVTELLEVLRHPYDEQPDKVEFAKKRPDWARHRAGCSMLSCSS